MWTFTHVDTWTSSAACPQASSFRDEFLQAKDSEIWREQRRSRKCECWKRPCMNYITLQRRKLMSDVNLWPVEEKITQKKKYVSNTNIPSTSITDMLITMFILFKNFSKFKNWILTRKLHLSHLNPLMCPLMCFYFFKCFLNMATWHYSHILCSGEKSKKEQKLLNVW